MAGSSKHFAFAASGDDVAPEGAYGLRAQRKP